MLRASSVADSRCSAVETAKPSLTDATPTRPGELGYTNELLFVEMFAAREWLEREEQQDLQRIINQLFIDIG